MNVLHIRRWFPEFSPGDTSLVENVSSNFMKFRKPTLHENRIKSIVIY